MREATKYVRETVDEKTGAITTPIYQTAAFDFPQGEKYRYSRELNPTVEELNRKIAEAERTEMGVSFSSGMGSISSTAFALLRPGSRVLIHVDVFARTLRFFKDLMGRFGVETVVTPPGNEKFVEALSSGKFDLAFVESISNPVLNVMDVETIGKTARESNVILVVDNTFATPTNLNPTVYGAHVVIHSASKFISGHNDVIAGLAAGKRELMERIDQTRRTLGTSLDPHAAFLVIRGFKTLKVRMEAIERNAMALAEYLAEHPKVKKVYYPGLPSHETHDVAKRLLKGYGGVLSFEIKGGKEEAYKLMNNLKVILRAQTIGGVNSTISHPLTMSHRTLTKDEAQMAMISESLIRLSVGIEDQNDLIEDLDNALRSI
ncbi:MAG: aminotransferase class I/II-fold pyridoxal phosphate-dependent enzyme [Sulfolobales archaeon]|nr:aminotransferase class I/II-fold pyridoxal phosphate-dependent enzyme [Sulfolobales archaeon]MCQ4448839.1 aminotransferase class I/II-fold pyridoxal phosphate-dependent enzyme [Sulfolobales archaeon]